MKTKHLIRLLQEADPSGELECCVGNVDILDVSVEPAWYDGTLQVLRRDPAKEPYYNVVGADFIRTGNAEKVVIDTHSIYDAIYQNAELPVGYIDCGQQYEADLRKAVEETRRKSRQVKLDVAWWSFSEWVKKRVGEFAECRLSEGDVKDVAMEFAREHIHYNDPMPEDILKIRKPWTDKDGRVYEAIPSWQERRFMQWDRELEITFDDGCLEIRRRPASETVAVA